MDHRSNIVSRPNLVAAQLRVILTIVVAVLPATSAAGQTFADFLVGNLNRATSAAFAPGETGRIFVNEQFTGDIWLVDLNNRVLLPTPVLHRDVAFDGPEQGLLGLVFDPDFANNGFFYLYY